MPNFNLEEVVGLGIQENVPVPEIAQAVKAWHKETLTEARYHVKDQEDFWNGSAAIDREVSNTLEGLRTQAQLQAAQQAFPNPVQFQQFNDVLASSGYDPDAMDAPPEWIDTAKKLDAIAQDPIYSTPRHQYGKIGFGPNKLADYSLREKEDGSGYEAVVFPTGDEGERRGAPLRVDLPPRSILAQTATTKAKTVGAQYDELSNGQQYGNTTISKEFEQQMEDSLEEQRIMNEGRESDALHIALTQKLKTNEQFIASIPQNNFQQFTTRPLLGVMRSLAQAGSAITGTGADILGEEGQNAVDLAAPGRMRARFETAGPTVGDAIGQGIESLVTIALPGGIVKAGGAALRATSAAGEGMAVLQSARGANFAGSAAYGTLGATSYGANYASAMQEADAAQLSGDVTKADRIRRYAQLTSFLKAGIEMATERIFPDEANLVSGKRITGREIATMPVKEGIEEGVGATAQNQVNLIDGQQDQNPLEASWQGALGAIPFMGAMTLQKLRQKSISQTRSAAGPASAVRPDPSTTNTPTDPGSSPGTAPNTAFSAGTGTDSLPPITGPGPVAVDGSLLAPPNLETETAPAPEESQGPDATLFPTPDQELPALAPATEAEPAPPDVTTPTEQDPMGTVPETVETTDEQYRRVKSGTKPGMIFPGRTAKQVDAAYQPGQEDDLVITDTPAGAVLHPIDIPRAEVRKAVETNTLGHLLGYGIPAKPAFDPNAAPQVAVTLRNAAGTEVDSVLTTPEMAPAVVEKLNSRAEPGDTVQTETPEAVIQGRMAPVPEVASVPEVPLVPSVPSVPLAASTIPQVRQYTVYKTMPDGRIHQPNLKPMTHQEAVIYRSKMTNPADWGLKEVKPTAPKSESTPNANLTAGIDPTRLLSDLRTLYRAAQDFASFSASALRKIGNWIQPHLAALWEGLKAAGGKLTEQFLYKIGALQYAVDPSQSRNNQNPNAEPNPTPSAVSPVPDYDTNRFGLRVQADERLRASWRATFPPATYKTFTEEALRTQVREWIADNGGLEGAAALFLDPTSGLQDYERNALGQQVALSLDLRARRMENAKNAAGVAQAEAALDQVIGTLETLATQAGQALRAFGMWSKFSPRGIVRTVQRETARKRDEHAATTLSVDPQALVDALNKLDPTTATDEENEILNLWRVMQQNADKPQGLAIAEVLKTLMPQRADYRKRIDAQSVQAGFRQQMTDAGGQSLARNFWRIMAGPQPGKTSLSLFDGATQQSLADLLTRAMQAAGLDSQHTATNQPTDVDKLVASLSVDPLRWDKINKANEAVEKAINEMEDTISVTRVVNGREVQVPVSREQLRAAWEESTRDMAQHMASPGLLRRLLRQDIAGNPIAWKQLFDTGRPVQQSTAAARTAAVNRIMATVQGRMAPGFNLTSLQNELSTAFDEIATERYAGWLVQREATAAQARRNEARKRMMAALRPQMQTQEATDRLDALFATYVVGGTPNAAPPRSELTALLQNHLREAVPDFVAQMQALGVPANVATEYDSAVKWHRQQAAERANRRMQDQLVKQLAPKTRAARDATPRFIKALLEARRNGALSRADFLDAYSQAFKLPRFTPEFSATLRTLAARVEATPQGSWLRNRAQSDLMTALANWEGLKAGDIWTAFWYANILSGLGTQLVNVSGNASHLLLKTSTVMLSNHPKHMMQFFRGMASGFKAGAKQAKQAFINGEPVLRGDEQWQKRDVLEMLWSDKPTTWGKLIGKYGAASWGRYVFRALTAMDAMFYNTAKEARAFLEISRSLQPGQTMNSALGQDSSTIAAAQAQAKSDLQAAGVTASPNNIDRRTLEILETKRTADVLATARKWGGAVTYNYDPQGTMGAFAAGINAMQRGFPPIRAVIPFTRIVANLTDQALDWTGYGLVRAALGKHTSDALRNAMGQPNAKAELFTARERAEKAIAGALGLAGMSALYALASANKDDDDVTVPFMIYAGGPPDKNRREQMPPNWKPYSLKIGDKFYSYAESPLTLVLGAFGAAMDKQRYSPSKPDDGDIIKRSELLLAGAGKSISRSGILSGLNNLFGIIDGTASGKTFVARTASGFTPAQGFLRDIAKFMDPQAVDTSTIEGVMLQNLPYLRTLAGKKLNVFGEPVKEPGPWLISRLVTKLDPSDADAIWVSKNGLHIPDLDAEIVVGKYLTQGDLVRLKNGYAPTETQRQALIAQRDAGYLTAQQREDLLKATGPELRKTIQYLQTQQQYNPTQTTKQLQNTLQTGVEIIRQNAMRKIIGL